MFYAVNEKLVVYWLPPCSVYRSIMPALSYHADSWTTARGIWKSIPSCDSADVMTGCCIIQISLQCIDIVGNGYLIRGAYNVMSPCSESLELKYNQDKTLAIFGICWWSHLFVPFGLHQEQYRFHSIFMTHDFQVMVIASMICPCYLLHE